MKVRQMNTYKVCRYSELGLATTKYVILAAYFSTGASDTLSFQLY